MKFTPTVVSAIALAVLFTFPVTLEAQRKMPKKYLGWVALSGVLGNFLPLFLLPIPLPRHLTKLNIRISNFITHRRKCPIFWPGFTKSVQFL